MTKRVPMCQTKGNGSRLTSQSPITFSLYTTGLCEDTTRALRQKRSSCFVVVLADAPSALNNLLVNSKTKSEITTCPCAASNSASLFA